MNIPRTPEIANLIPARMCEVKNAIADAIILNAQQIYNLCMASNKMGGAEGEEIAEETMGAE